MILTDEIKQQFMEYSQMNVCNRAYTRYKYVLDSLTTIANGREITSEVVMDWTNYLLNVRKTSRNSVCCYRWQAGAFFNWCVAMGHIDKNPIRRIKNLFVIPPDRTPITINEYIRLQQATQYRPERYWLYYMITMAWNTGMRCKDIALLKWENVNMLNRSITFFPYKTVRFKKRVELPITDPLYYFLAEEKLKAGHNIYVNKAAAEHHMKKRVITPFREVANEIGLPKNKSLHCFRHSFITRLLEANISPAIICTMTGQNVEEVMTYQHIGLEAKRAAMLNAI